MKWDRGRTSLFLSLHCLAKGVGYIHVADFARPKVVNGLMKRMFLIPEKGERREREKERRHNKFLLSFHYSYRKPPKG